MGTSPTGTCRVTIRRIFYFGSRWIAAEPLVRLCERAGAEAVVKKMEKLKVGDPRPFVDGRYSTEGRRFYIFHSLRPSGAQLGLPC